MRTVTGHLHPTAEACPRIYPSGDGATKKDNDMSVMAKSKFEETVERLGDSLDRFEQQTQEIRWRVGNFPDELRAMNDVIAELAVGACRVAVIFGELVALKGSPQVEMISEVVNPPKLSASTSFEALKLDVEEVETAASPAEIKPDQPVADATSGPINDAPFVEKMKNLRAQSVARCREVAEKLIVEAGVKKAVHDQNGLKGYANVMSGGKPVGVIHVPVPTTRRRLYVFAHECGHVALGHDGSVPYHRQEFEAERWAHAALRRHGIAVPEKETQRAKEYVARKIHQAVVRGAKRIDRESHRFSRDHASPTVMRWLDAGGILCDLSLGKAGTSLAAA